MTPLIAMAGYSDVLDESTLALISEIDQVHRGQQQQDLVKYVNSLMSLGRHLQLYKSSDPGSTNGAACPSPSVPRTWTSTSTWRKNRLKLGSMSGPTTMPPTVQGRCCVCSCNTNSRSTSRRRCSHAMAVTSHTPPSYSCP